MNYPVKVALNLFLLWCAQNHSLIHSLTHYSTLYSSFSAHRGMLKDTIYSEIGNSNSQIQCKNKRLLGFSPPTQLTTFTFHPRCKQRLIRSLTWTAAGLRVLTTWINNHRTTSSRLRDKTSRGWFTQRTHDYARVDKYLIAGIFIPPATEVK